MNYVFRNISRNVATGVFALCISAAVAAVSFALPVSASADSTPPIIISVSSSGTTLTVTTSEPVWTPNPVGQYDFMLSNCLGEPLEDGVVNGLASTSATADNSFTVTFSKGTCTGDRLIYSSHHNTTNNQIRDVAGNKMPMQGNQTDGNIINGGGIQPPVQNPDDGGDQTPQDPTPPSTPPAPIPPNFLDTDPVAGVPTITKVVADGNSVTVTMSEKVFTHGDVSFGYGGLLYPCGNSLLSITGTDIPTTVATAADSFTVSFSDVPYVTHLLYLHGNTNSTKPIMDQAGNKLGQYGNTDAYGGGTNRVKDSNGNPIACPGDEDPDDGDDTPRQPTDGVTAFGNLVITGSTGRFAFSYACSGVSCSDNYAASYVFTDTITCDSSVGGMFDVSLTDAGSGTKQSAAIDVSDGDGKYMCVRASDNNVNRDFYKSYQMPAQIQEAQAGAGITIIGHHAPVYTSPSTDPGVIVLPPTAKERIELARTTTSIAVLTALVPLHPVAVAKNPICPASVLTQLHTSSRKWVRYWVARHKNTATEVLNTLVNDSDSEVARAAKNNLNSR